MNVRLVGLDGRVVWFSEVDLRVAAGPKSFARGRDLVDAVARVKPTAEGFRAVVHGTNTYDVFLGPASPGLFGECSCPFGEAGNFCKHCVAVGLVVLAGGNSVPNGDSPSRAASSSSTPQIAVLQRQFDAALQVRGSVDADGSVEYARIADDVLDTVEGLIGSGHAAEARPLGRRAMERITDSLLLIDDASGVVGAACQRALGLYARACAVARPNAARLAGWLFRLELDSPGWPTIDLSDFAEALGDAGLSAYRALVDEAWDKRVDADIRRALTLLVMREKLAKLDGNVDGLAALADELSESLPSPAAFLGVAAGDAAGGASAPWLVEFLVQAYLDGGRGHDALELRRWQLSALPKRDQYAKLRDTARVLDAWSEVRPWAIDLLRASAEQRRSGDELVAALLDDGEVDEAWHAAVSYECASRLWLVVARHRKDSHPLDVLPGYRSRVLECAARTGRENYREAVGLLVELREASGRCGRLAEFQEFVNALRERYRRKSALLDELDRGGLG